MSPISFKATCASTIKAQENDEKYHSRGTNLFHQRGKMARAATPSAGSALRFSFAMP
jgi:hypothetical protein